MKSYFARRNTGTISPSEGRRFLAGADRAISRIAAAVPVAAALLAAILLFAAPAGHAQDARQRAARSRTVRSLMNQAVIQLRIDPLQSIRQIQRLLADYPEEKQFIYEKLGYAYAYASMPDSAMAAYEACVALEPIQLSAARELAQLYINHGQQEHAERLFAEMLRRSPSRLHAYRAVSEAQSGAGWHLQALETYRRARAELGNPDMFALEIGDLEKMAGNVEIALEEYLRYAVSAHANINTAQDKISELLQNPTADRGQAFAVLERHARADDIAYRQRVLAILSYLYYGDALYEKALESALESDRLQVNDGRFLYALIQRLSNDYQADAKRKNGPLLDLCLRASDAYLIRHPKAAEAPGVYLMRASMLAEKSAARVSGLTPAERDDALESAIAGLDQVMRRYPGTRFAERAILLKGDILLAFRDKEAALNIYLAGSPQAKEYRGEFAERIARTYLAMGRYDAGRDHCARLIRAKDRHLAETGYYYMGLLLACAGDHEAARDTLTAFAERSPGSAYTNDAIDLAWAIELGIRLDEDILGDYIGVLSSEFAGDSSATLAALERFAAMEPGTPLRPRALFRLGNLYADWGAYEKALGTYTLFLEQYPDHALVPDIERRIGYVYEMGFADSRRALERFEHVLMAYPEYVFLDEVRRDVVRLRASEQGK